MHAAQRALAPVSELLIWTKRVSSPAAANSFSQKKRAKKPRSSPRFSRSIDIGAVERRRMELHACAPYAAVARTLYERQRRSAPSRASADVAFEHLQPHERRIAEFGSANPMPRRPARRAAGSTRSSVTCGMCAGASVLNRREVDPVGALVGRRAGVDRDPGSRHAARDRLGELAAPGNCHSSRPTLTARNLPPFSGGAADRPFDRARHVRDVDQRPPWRAVAEHGDLAATRARRRRSR